MFVCFFIAKTFLSTCAYISVGLNTAWNNATVVSAKYFTKSREDCFCVLIYVLFSLRGIGKQGFQCQGRDKPSVQYLIFSDDFLCVTDSFLNLSVFSSLQFCGPQKMSRVCDLHLSRLCCGPQTRCEQICQHIQHDAFTLTSPLVFHFCQDLWQHHHI